jgi:hypothetical protein
MVIEDQAEVIAFVASPSAHGGAPVEVVRRQLAAGAGTLDWTRVETIERPRAGGGDRPPASSHQGLLVRRGPRRWERMRGAVDYFAARRAGVSGLRVRGPFRLAFTLRNRYRHEVLGSRP